MKIVLVNNSDFNKGGGIGVRLVPIAQALAKYDVTIFCRSYDKTFSKFDLHTVVPFGRFFMQGLTALRVYISSKLSRAVTFLRAYLFDLFLKKKLRKINNIAFLHSWESLPKTYAFLKKKHPRIKIVQDVSIALPTVLLQLKSEPIWNKYSSTVPQHVQNAFAYVDLYIVPSKFVQKSLVAAGISASKIKIIPFGVDATRFQPRKKSKTFRVAFAGNISHRKGIKYLLKAWDILSLPNAELHLYGRVFPEVRALLNKAPRSVVVHGFSDLAQELPKNNIYVFPSLMEGSSKSTYEALAAGLPVVTTPNAGSVVRDKKEGFIVPPQDVGSLVKKIKYFYTNPEQVRLFSTRARKQAESYSWERYARAVTTSYLK